MESCDAVLSLSEPTMTTVEPVSSHTLNKVSLLISWHNNSQEMKNKVNRAETGLEQQRQKRQEMIHHIIFCLNKTNQDHNYKTVKRLSCLKSWSDTENCCIQCVADPEKVTKK